MAISSSLCAYRQQSTVDGKMSIIFSINNNQSPGMQKESCLETPSQPDMAAEELPQPSHGPPPPAPMARLRIPDQTRQGVFTTWLKARQAQ
ncbi:MAG: hypothetical protein KJ822_16640 [Proteobacteria bacterium]|nr:hypothetical protein [Pseudomonadota bacterium]